MESSPEEDLLITEVDDEALAEKILNKLVIQKKVKQNLTDDLEQLASSFENVISQMIK